MRILFIGDVVARPGRRAVLNNISDLRQRHEADAVIMNAENVAGGFSITPPIADELFEAGIDLMTSGNHIFDKQEVVPYLRKQPRLLRPANYPPGTPGSGSFVGEIAGRKVAVLNLLGRVFMPPVDDPFRAADKFLASLDEDVRIQAAEERAQQRAFLAEVLSEDVTVDVRDRRLRSGTGTRYSAAGTSSSSRRDARNRSPNRETPSARMRGAWFCR